MVVRHYDSFVPEAMAVCGGVGVVVAVAASAREERFIEMVFEIAVG